MITMILETTAIPNIVIAVKMGRKILPAEDQKRRDPLETRDVEEVSLISQEGHSDYYWL